MNHCNIDSTVFRVYECTYERCALDHGAVHGSNSNTNLGFIKHSYIINKARDCSHYISLFGFRKLRIKEHLNRVIKLIHYFYNYVTVFQVLSRFT